LLHENIDLEINAVLRDYGDNPTIATSDSPTFKRDFNNFKKKLLAYESQAAKLKSEYSSLSIKQME
jgi:hypothetical protein